MKKLLFISLGVVALGFMSCKKCQTCTTTTSTSISGATPTTFSGSEEYCGKEYDNAPAESSVSTTVGSIETTIAIDCVDN